MPAARPNSSKSSKSKAPELHLTSKPYSKSSFYNGPKRFPCRAWWCESTFARHTDMMKHISSEHFGKRSCCPICSVLMKQDSNLSTHLNAHLSNYCTVCSCGRGFKDPSAYTRHRETSGHSKGATHGKIRPTIVKGIKVQHVAGLALNLEIISNPSFVPPPFDASYHLKGIQKPKGQEKYNSNDYIELSEAPTVPSVQMAEPLSTVGAPVEYHRTKSPVPLQTEVEVGGLGVGTNYSYEVELPRDARCTRVANGDVYAERHDNHIYNPQIPSGAHATHPTVASPYPTTTCHPTDANQENFYFPPPSQHSFQSQVQPEYQETSWYSWTSRHAPLSIASLSYGTTAQQNFFEEMVSPTRTQYPPQVNFYDQTYHPTLVAY